MTSVISPWPKGLCSERSYGLVLTSSAGLADREYLETEVCVEALEEALGYYGAPEVFNTDQGAQYTSEAFPAVLKAQGV